MHELADGSAAVASPAGRGLGASPPRLTRLPRLLASPTADAPRLRLAADVFSAAAPSAASRGSVVPAAAVTSGSDVAHSRPRLRLNLRRFGSGSGCVDGGTASASISASDAALNLAERRRPTLTAAGTAADGASAAVGAGADACAGSLSERRILRLGLRLRLRPAASSAASTA